MVTTKKIAKVTITVLAWYVMWFAGSARAQWSNAQLFNMAYETGADVKTAKIAAARTGGFHGIYHVNSRIRYRRYSGGTLTNPVDVFPGTNFIANGAIAEALNGDIHVVLEDWAGGGPEIRWYKSSNGGASFPFTQILSATGGCAKHPHIAAYGMGTSAEAIMSYYRADSTGGCDKSLYFARYNGSTWSAEASLGSYSNSAYDCFGMARSPLDGSVYRSYDPNMSSMAMRRYADAWGPQINLNSGAWPVRQHMAINATGQVMLLWDQDERIKSQLYTPGVGSGPVIDVCASGYCGACDVCWLPGTNDFYMVVARPTGGGGYHVYGRRWTAGAWLGEESVMNGLADAFTVSPVVAADETGALYCIWEYWGSGKPQQWYAVKPSSLPPGPKGTISGFVRDNFGTGLPNATVIVTGVPSAVSQSNGFYALSVPVGTHNVQASKTFYSSQIISGVTVYENQTTTVNFTLLTQAPTPVVSLAVTAGNALNQLSWTNSTSLNCNGVVIRFSTTGYPTRPSDGQLLLDRSALPGSNDSFVHTGLVNGTRIYYTAFNYFQDASRFYSTGRNASGLPYGVGDHDRDGDVDQVDFGHFQTCFSGAFVPQNDPNCLDARLDSNDEDVDMDDFAIFMGCFAGPGIPTDPDCANQ
ncbi:MAG: carboxypeptidase-like regulatory domain-containing protein [Phycisphaerae bacterium]